MRLTQVGQERVEERPAPGGCKRAGWLLFVAPILHAVALTAVKSTYIPHEYMYNPALSLGRDSILSRTSPLVVERRSSRVWLNVTRCFAGCSCVRAYIHTRLVPRSFFLSFLKRGVFSAGVHVVFFPSLTSHSSKEYCCCRAMIRYNDIGRYRTKSI